MPESLDSSTVTDSFSITVGHHESSTAVDVFTVESPRILTAAEPLQQSHVVAIEYHDRQMEVQADDEAFAAALSRAVTGTLEYLPGRIDSIWLNLLDIQYQDSLQWQQVELVVCLNSPDYSLADIVFMLAEQVYGSILADTGFFLTTTILAREEFEPQDHHLLLTVQVAPVQYQMDTSDYGGEIVVPNRVSNDLRASSGGLPAAA